MTGGARGRFITFEGGEGAGKSTQVSMLADRLRSLGIDVVVTREPGGSPGAEIIRHVLLSGVAKPLGPDAEAMLFAAARDDHLVNTIRPALARGSWVVCDRFADSTRVYQGALGHVDARLIRRLESLTVGPTRPDLTIILDLPAEDGLARAERRRGVTPPDRYEAETLDFHNKLREAYHTLAQDEPGRCVLIDAALPRSSVARRIWDVVVERFDPATAPRAVAEVS